jgi:hypothetical protein
MGSSLIGGFNPPTLFNPAAQTAPGPSNVCKGIDVKATDSDEKLIEGIKQFMKNSVFQGKTEAQVQAVPARDRWNAMAKQADTFSTDQNAWKKFSDAGCNFGFTPKPEKAGQLKQMMEGVRDELLDPSPDAVKHNLKF